MNRSHFLEFSVRKGMELVPSSHSGCGDVCDTGNLRTNLMLEDKNRAFGIKESKELNASSLPCQLWVLKRHLLTTCWVESTVLSTRNTVESQKGKKTSDLLDLTSQFRETDGHCHHINN